MTKTEYISRLTELLSDLDQGYVSSSVQYYTEMIDDRIEDGLTEDEALNAIGSPEETAERIRSESTEFDSNSSSESDFEPIQNNAPTTEAETITDKKQKKGLTVLAWILIILGFPVWGSILVGIISAVFSFFCALWAVVISAWAVSCALIGIGVYYIVYSIIAFITAGAGTGLFCLGTGILVTGISLFAIIGSKYLSKGVLYITKLIPCSIVKLFKERRGK
jgi:uncharacterized membrane protein